MHEECRSSVDGKSQLCKFAEMLGNVRRHYPAPCLCVDGPIMAERRMISRKIATNGKLAGVSLRAAYLHQQCIPFLDRDRRISGEEATINGRVVPLRAEIPLEDIPAILDELVAQRLVVWYEAVWDGTTKRVLYPRFPRRAYGAVLSKEKPSEFRSADGPTVKALVHAATLGKSLPSR